MGHLRRAKKMLAPKLYELQWPRSKAIKARRNLKVIAMISTEWLAKKRKKVLRRLVA